jgi:hypothetical protein
MGLTLDEQILLVRMVKMLSAKQGWRTTADKLDGIERRLFEEKRALDFDEANERGRSSDSP